MESYIPLEIDSNFCPEMETRLGPYGYQAKEVPQTPTEFRTPGPAMDDSKAGKAQDGSILDWEKLQQLCYETNLDRYSKSRMPQPLLAAAKAIITTRNANSKLRSSHMSRKLDMIVKNS